MKLLKQVYPALIGVIMCFVLMFGTGMLPKLLAKNVVKNYVFENNYTQMHYANVSFDSHRDTYLVTYKDVHNQIYNFYVNSKWIPTLVLYDPLKPVL